MDTVERAERHWTADEFLAADQHEFGPGWRYELVAGRIVAHAAPSPDHGAILSGLTMALGTRLRGNSLGCRPESGSGAAPARKQRNTARIPDAMIRCRGVPRVVFEVVSPSELKDWRARDVARRDLQDVEGVAEIVEIYHDDMAVHVYRRETDGGWSFEAIGGAEAVLRLPSVAIEVPLAEIYEFTRPGQG